MLDGSKIRAWVFKNKCPKCGKTMGKPVDPKTGKVKKRSDIYVCECGNTENVAEVNPTLTVNVDYRCPFCSHEGQTTTLFKRKSWQGVPAFVFECEKCKEKIGITKKMKVPKKK